nr:hypothetical protein GCM10020093_025060 [Planobispora longispora]
MIDGCRSQPIKNRGRVRVPSSPIDVLTHHREHVTSTAPIASPDDLPAPADVLDTPPDPRSRRGRRYRLGSLLALSLIAVLGGAASWQRSPDASADTTPTCWPVPGCPAPPPGRRHPAAPAVTPGR